MLPCCTEDHELEQPYVRLHEDVSVALLARFLHERVLLVSQNGPALRLHCRGQRLKPDMKLGDVQRRLWAPHARGGQPLHIAMDWQSAPKPESAPA